MNQPVTFQVNGTFMRPPLFVDVPLTEYITVEASATDRDRGMEQRMTGGSAAPQRALVMGASGFVGSHVTRLLADRGDDVRVLLRKSSSTKGIDDLDVARHYGDLTDLDAVRAAMSDRDVVYYCVVDARAWLRDPTPLFATNVEALRGVLDVACEADLTRFVFTSTIGTIAVGGASARDAVTEDLVLRYARERGLPAVAMCVSNTYGPGDWQPTPHGGMVKAAALGRMPAFVRGAAAEVVGIEDAAEAMLLAADRGRVGERYIISESYLPMRTLFEIAADEAGVKPPRLGLPMALVYAAGLAGSVAGAVLRRDSPLTLTSARLLHLTSPLDHGKATRELGWNPSPTTDAVRRAVRFYRRTP
jgi:dihydroflavonol-4-reductase